MGIRGVAIGFVAGCILGAVLWPEFGSAVTAQLAPFASAWQSDSVKSQPIVSTTIDIDDEGRLFVRRLPAPAGDLHPTLVAAAIGALSCFALLAWPGKVLRAGH